MREQLSKNEAKRRAKKAARFAGSQMPKFGDTAVLTVSYKEPGLVGRKVIIQRITDDDWYTETFGDVRYWITDYSYLLAEDFAEHYAVQLPESSRPAT